MEKSTFLIDTNTFITPYRSYYSFDFAPLFWSRLEKRIEDGSIVILDKVHSELTTVKDDLSDWLLNIKACNPIKHKDPAIIKAYSNTLTYIQESGLYKSKALAEWSENRIADPWLIACANVCKHTVVTFEKPDGNLSKRNPSSHPKIPDVCKAFGIAHTDLFNMMRALSISVS
jgi:hypothetical protein